MQISGKERGKGADQADDDDDISLAKVDAADDEAGLVVRGREGIVDGTRVVGGERLDGRGGGEFSGHERLHGALQTVLWKKGKWDQSKIICIISIYHQILRTRHSQPL